MKHSRGFAKLVQGIAGGLGAASRYGSLHEKDFETRGAFEAAARRQYDQAQVIVYSTEPVDLGDVPALGRELIVIQLPEVADLPRATGG